MIGLSEISIRPDYLPGGGVEQNPQQLFDSVVQAGRLAIAATGGTDIDVVSFANQGESVLAWDRLQDDLYPYSSRNDMAAAPQTIRVVLPRRTRGGDLARVEDGNPPTPGINSTPETLDCNEIGDTGCE